MSIRFGFKIECDTDTLHLVYVFKNEGSWHYMAWWLLYMEV
jgi:hypothetical protein